MNKQIKNISLLDILPDSLLQDEQVQACIKALDIQLQAVTADVIEVIHLPRLDELPEEVIDLLAWQFHVDFYEPLGMDLETKRNLVRESIAWHRIKGTPAAVEKVCRAAFKSVEVAENWEYGGEPYHFRVQMIGDALPDGKALEDLHRAINSAKNVRSQLDGIEFYREAEFHKYWGSALSMHKDIELGQAAINTPEVAAGKYHGGFVDIHRELEVSL